MWHGLKHLRSHSSLRRYHKLKAPLSCLFPDTWQFLSYLKRNIRKYKYVINSLLLKRKLKLLVPTNTVWEHVTYYTRYALRYYYYYTNNTVCVAYSVFKHRRAVQKYTQIQIFLFSVSLLHWPFLTIHCIFFKLLTHEKIVSSPGIRI